MVFILNEVSAEFDPIAETSDAGADSHTEISREIELGKALNDRAARYCAPPNKNLSVWSP